MTPDNTVWKPTVPLWATYRRYTVTATGRG